MNNPEEEKQVDNIEEQASQEEVQSSEPVESEKKPEETTESAAVEEAKVEEVVEEVVAEETAKEEAPAEEAPKEEAAEEVVEEIVEEVAVEEVVKAVVEEKPAAEAQKPVAAKEKAPAPAVAEVEVPDSMEKVISINRITKVTKGGKKLSFSALVVVGDMNGNVGYSLSKASEVATAIRKAMGIAKKNMVSISLKGTTIPHEIIGRCGGARVLLKPASDGTGVIASGPVRAVCDGVGIHNILTKCHRSNNPINVVKATIDGLTRLKTVSNRS